MKKLLGAVSALALTFAAGQAMADETGCDSGEMVIKFSHVVAGSGHPKGDACPCSFQLRGSSVGLGLQ